MRSLNQSKIRWIAYLGLTLGTVSFAGQGNGNGNPSVKTVVAGSGLAGGGNGPTVTVSVANQGITMAMLAPATVAGLTGAVGPKGDTGETGVAGPKGDKGDQGEQGVQGPPGLDASGSRERALVTQLNRDVQLPIVGGIYHLKLRAFQVTVDSAKYLRITVRDVLYGNYNTNGYLDVIDSDGNTLAVDLIGTGIGGDHVMFDQTVPAGTYTVRVGLYYGYSSPEYAVPLERLLSEATVNESQALITVEQFTAQPLLSLPGTDPTE